MAATLTIEIEVDREGRARVREIERDVTRAFDRLKSSAGGASGAFDRLKRSVFSLKGALVALGIGALANSFLDAASAAEGYQTRLQVLLGSQKEANDLFKAAAEYAAQVPFEYRDIMDAATQLAGVMRGGVEEVRQWLPLIGDLAAASGLSIQQTTEQVVRMYSAGAGAADLFRERGILAMLGFQAGVSYSAEETRRRLVEAWQAAGSQFRGATELMADDWKGITSMMSDKWFQFRERVMGYGVFDALKIQTQEWDRALGDMLRPGGTLDRLAQRLGQIVDDFFGVGALRGRLAAIDEEIEDLQGRLQGAPPREGGFFAVLAADWQGTLQATDAELEARLKELKAERERLQKWLAKIEAARKGGTRDGGGGRPERPRSPVSAPAEAPAPPSFAGEFAGADEWMQQVEFLNAVALEATRRRVREQLAAETEAQRRSEAEWEQHFEYLQGLDYTYSEGLRALKEVSIEDQQAIRDAEVRAEEQKYAMLYDSATTYYDALSARLQLWAEEHELTVQTVADATAGLMDSAIQGFSAAVSQALVYGKSFAQTLEQMYRQIAAQMIQTVVQWTVQGLVQSLIRQKAAAAEFVAQSAQNVSLAATKAGATYAYLGPGAGAVAAATAAAVQAAGVAAYGAALGAFGGLAGVAHGGLDYVPREATYLLDKGEAVVRREQNADLRAFLEAWKRGEIGAPRTIVIENRLSGRDLGRTIVELARDGEARSGRHALALVEV